MFHPNWADLFEAIADLDPSADAIVQGDRRLSWGDFDQRAARVASALGAMNVGPGSTVSLFLYNCPEYLEIAYGCFKVGAVPTNVNFRYRTEELRYLLKDSQSSVLVFHGALADVVSGLGEDRPANLLQIDDGEGSLADGAVWYEDIVENQEEAVRDQAPPRDGANIIIQYTGGTTGMPKGVLWAHGDLFEVTCFPAYVSAGLPVPGSIAEVVDAAQEMRGSGSAPVMLCAPPLIHGTALFLAMSALLRGGRVVLLNSRKFDPAELWRDVERERVTDLAIVGDSFARPLVEALVARERAGKPVDLSSLRAISSSGVTWSSETKTAFRQRGQMLLIDILGASEGGPLAVSITEANAMPSKTSTFTISDRAVLLDENGQEMSWGTGEAGLIALKGSGPLGYLNDPDKTRQTFREYGGQRFIVTGDYVEVDAAGVLTFKGRGNACINTGGEKVYPEEVEEALRTHKDVVDCNVVGIPDAQYGEAIVGIVEMRAADTGTTDDQLIEHVKSKLAGYKQPRHIVRVEKLFRAPNGKSDYRLAKQIALDAIGR